MSTIINLNVSVRDDVGKKATKAIRSSGRVPAILYGSEMDPLPISFHQREFLKLTHNEVHENILFDISMQNNGKTLTKKAIIKEKQLDNIYSQIIHIDFLEISMNKEIEIHVPVEFTGIAVGVKEQGGMLDIPIREILISCLPMNMPEKIVVDISNLHLGHAIHIKDIELSQDVVAKDDPSKVVASVVLKAKTEDITTKVEGGGESQEESKEPEVATKKTKE